MPDYSLAERRQIEQLVERESAEIQRAFASFLRRVRNGTVLRRVASLLQKGDIDGALEIVDAHVVEFADVLPKVFIDAAEAEMGPASSKIGTEAISFDPGLPAAAKVMEASRLNLIQQFGDDQRSVVRRVLTSSLKAGEGPIAAARKFRDSIGLTDRQEAAVENYRSLLETGSSEALARQLRDRRTDSSVLSSIENDEPLSSKQVDRMVEGYRGRMLAYRSENIARTEGLRAVSEARRAAWAQTLDEAGIDPDTVTRTWAAIDDKRTRDTHADMDGQEVQGFDEPFVSSSGAELLYPGDPDAPAEEVCNCRCSELLNVGSQTDTEKRRVDAVVQLCFDRGRILELQKRLDRTKIILKAYNPDEPRDEHGKWTGQLYAVRADHTKRVYEVYNTRDGATVQTFKYKGTESSRGVAHGRANMVRRRLNDEQKAKQVLKAYNPDEPRDDHGRWTGSASARREAISNVLSETKIGFSDPNTEPMRGLINQKIRASGGKDLSQEEYQVLRAYMGYSFGAINEPLRLGMMHDSNARAVVNTMDSALNKLPVYSGAVTRGVDLKPEELSQFKVGSPFVNNSYMSGTVGDKLAANFKSSNTILKITSKTGRKFAAVSAFGSSEAEVLFPRGTRFNVESVKSKGGKKIVMLRELTTLKKVFDPDEPRDYHGRWTAGSGGEGTESISTGKGITRELAYMEASKVAKDLGFDRDKIVISDETHTFMLNGKEWTYAGAADIRAPIAGSTAPPSLGMQPGQIVVFNKHVSEQTVSGLVAHEIEHQKFQTALDAYRRESDLMQKDPGPAPDPNGQYYWQKRGGNDAVMTPSGSLRPPYDTKYPAYTAMHEAFYANPMDLLADSDGVSGYSAEYWKGWKNGTVPTNTAVHETLAEMSRITYEWKQDRARGGTLKLSAYLVHHGEELNRLLSYRVGAQPRHGESEEMYQNRMMNAPKPPTKARLKEGERAWRNLFKTVEKVYKANKS